MSINMLQILRLMVAITVTYALQGCAAMTAHPVDAEQKVVGRYLEALSQRDLRLLTLYVTPDVEWYSVSKGQQTLESTGREQLIELLKAYFNRYAVTRWRAQQMMQTGKTVVIIEQSEWGENDVQSRAALGVFEFEDGRIKRLTYYLDTAN